ncbi:MAG TPA: DJ-1/PfpI family protein [Bryobacteraceae bacterium]|nr:DJ-1/PfpI family protein [Bryobacteraceae bacterium]
MTRRTLLTAVAGVTAAARFTKAADSLPAVKPLTPPDKGAIPVAVAISEGAVMIDYAGPWEVFQDANRPSGGHAFNLYTVAESTRPVTASGGLKLLPDFSFADAPAPKIIVIPAQSGNQAMLEWIRKSAKTADVVMSVCTGAFILAKTGLLDGKAATTHHASYGGFAMKYRDVRLKRGFRFVESAPNLATAGGLTSGIDLALHIVERYFGRASAEGTAYFMEYQGEGWKDVTGGANQAYLKPVSTSGRLACAVCGMALSADAPQRSTYKNVTYYFCSPGCQGQFDASPADFV